MALVHLISFIAIFVQTVTCQGVGNLNAGFNNGLPFGSNFANGLVGPSLGGPGLGGSGYVGNGGPSLVGPGFIGNGLGVSGLGSSGLVGSGFMGAGLGNPGLVGPGLAGSCRSSGGSFAVTSSSPIAPTGVSILAENLAIEGPLSVGGQLPFLGTIGVEGTMPATGSGTVSYGCGSGNIGITSDLAGQYGSATANQYGPGLAPGLAGYGMAGQGMGASLAGYNPGFGNAGLNGRGLVGPAGLFGNNMAGGLGVNMAGQGFGVANGAVLK